MPSPPAPCPPEVLAKLAAGVLVVGPDGGITFANDNAAGLFPLLSPIGHGLRSFLALSGVTNGGELADVAERRDGGGPVRIGLPDGRVFDGHGSPLANGGAVITLLDITPYARGSERFGQDALTGLPSRTGLHQRLSELLASSRRSGAAVAVIVVALDRHFKDARETLPYAAGDAFLVKVAERLRGASRKAESVARLGDTEFAVVQADEPQPRAAEALAKRLVDLIERPYAVSGHILNVGVNLGIAVAPDDGESADTLLHHASLALARARSEGSGGFRFFQAGMNDEMQARRLLEVDLRSAFTLKRFELAYQPQIRLEPRALIGFEALLRWNDPGRGAVPPGEFIPLTERIGLIVPIGEWVLQTACREAASWSRPVSIAVNVSPAQFRGARVVPMVTEALAASGLDPPRLELEITEGALLDNTETVLEQLRALKALGIRIAMDDFGTGYSSLSYLRKFPFDKIKIDQSFVLGCDDDPDRGALIEAIVALGTSLGVRTIAEGVETPAQLARLKTAGCNEVQGYLTGRPMSAGDATALMNEPTLLNNTPGQRP